MRSGEESLIKGFYDNLVIGENRALEARSEPEGQKHSLKGEESLAEKLYNVKSLPGLKLVAIDREITPGRMSAECAATRPPASSLRGVDDQRRGWRAAVAGACALTLLFAAAPSVKSSASKMLESFDSGPDPDSPGGCVYYYIHMCSCIIYTNKHMDADTYIHISIGTYTYVHIHESICIFQYIYIVYI